MNFDFEKAARIFKGFGMTVLGKRDGMKKQKKLSKYFPSIRCVVDGGNLSDGYKITALHYFGLIRNDALGYVFWLRGRVKKRGVSARLAHSKTEALFWKQRDLKNTAHFWRFMVQWGEF